jgi:hypothetical protein
MSELWTSLLLWQKCRYFAVLLCRSRDCLVGSKRGLPRDVKKVASVAKVSGAVTKVVRDVAKIARPVVKVSRAVANVAGACN